MLPQLQQIILAVNQWPIRAQFIKAQQPIRVRQCPTLQLVLTDLEVRQIHVFFFIYIHAWDEIDLFIHE